MGRHHGSLARAGKVKKSTPHGCVCDKKKKKTGRGRKRELYNKRFSQQNVNTCGMNKQT